MFDLDSFIGSCRASATLDIDAAKETVHKLMLNALATPQSILEGMPSIDEDERLLYEDDVCQVWYCGFSTSVHVPPHDHQCHAFVGVYEGVEANHMYHHDVNSNTLTYQSTVRIGVGDLLCISPDDIHSVESADNKKSRALHVYLGNLSMMKRQLFDWRTGDKIPFTTEKFNEFTAREDRPDVSLK